MPSALKRGAYSGETSISDGRSSGFGVRVRVLKDIHVDEMNLCL
jgi:hypothetical protein